MSATELLKTPLYALHLELGAKMVPFAGYDMPVNYPGGIIAEHRQTRESAALFDVVAIIMRLAPIGAFGAMAFTIGRYGLGSLLALGKLMAGVYLTCAFFIFIVLGAVARLTGFSADSATQSAVGSPEITGMVRPEPGTDTWRASCWTTDASSIFA